MSLVNGIRTHYDPLLDGVWLLEGMILGSSHYWCVCAGACVCVCVWVSVCVCVHARICGVWMGSSTHDILSSARAEVVCHG